MIAPRGGDPAGEMVTEAAYAAGINDRPFVFLDRKTPSYTAILERDGNLVIALADMELYRYFVPRRLAIRWVREAFAANDLILFDANLPEETIAAIVSRANSLGVPVAAIAISPAKVVKLKPCICGIDHLFLNEAEAAALTGQCPDKPEDWVSLLGDIGLKSGVITRGQRELIAFGKGGTFCLQPPSVETIADVTGAGDSARSRHPLCLDAGSAARGSPAARRGRCCTHGPVALCRQRKTLRANCLRKPLPLFSVPEFCIEAATSMKRKRQ